MIRCLPPATLVLMLIAAPAFGQTDPVAAHIIAMERAALDRWGKGDVNGYLEIMDDGVTYFDPIQDRRVDGRTSMTRMLEPFKGKIKIDRYELVEPIVQISGDIAVLSFRIVNYTRRPDGSEVVANRWNTSEVYRRTNGAWKIWHSHFSFTQPVLAKP